MGIDDRYRKVIRVLLIILSANLAVALIKIIVGSIINSTSMTADGFHSLTDGLSNIVGLIGIKLASKPIDKEHPYGHSKFEMLAGLFIAAMLFTICGRIIYEAVQKLIHPVIPEVSIESLILLMVSLCINVFVCLYEYRMGIRLDSQILVSDSMHTRSDIYVSIGVLATLLAIRLGLPPITDIIVSLLVAGFILHAAFEIFKDNSGILLDRAAIDTEKIKEIALDFEQVKDIHKIRSRGCKNNLYIDMHIMTDPKMSVEASHELTHRIEDRIRMEINENVQLIVHLEPYREDTEN